MDNQARLAERKSWFVARFALMALLAVASACSSSTTQPQNDGVPPDTAATFSVAADLPGTFWKLSSLEGFSSQPDAGIGTASLSFAEDGQSVGIWNGCNGSGTEIRIGDNTVTPTKPGPQTLVGCVGEHNLIRAFNAGTHTVERNGDTLILTRGSVTATFVAAETPPPQTQPDNNTELPSATTETPAVSTSDPKGKPPSEIDRISIPGSAGAFLHQESTETRATLCMPGGESQPVACFKLAAVDLDLSEPSLGAEIDSGPWRIYNVALTANIHRLRLTDVTLEAAVDTGSTYQCAQPANGDFPKWNQVRRAFRQWGVRVFDNSAESGQPSGAGPFHVNIFHIDREAFEDICTKTPGLTINAISQPIKPVDLPALLAPETIDPTAPIAVYQDEPGADSPDALLIGALEIEQRCVYVQPPDNQPRHLVLFSSLNTSWDPETKAVLSTDDNRRFSPYTNGDKVNLGGSSQNPTILDKLTWVLEPDPSCDTSQLWMTSYIS